jgi:hypothetical protein
VERAPTPANAGAETKLKEIKTLGRSVEERRFSAALIGQNHPGFSPNGRTSAPDQTSDRLQEGETMSKGTYPLRLPVSIKKAAQRLAKEGGVSLNQWIASAVAQKVRVVETAADFFKKRAGKATGAGLMKFLRTAPKAAPEPEDEMR